MTNEQRVKTLFAEANPIPDADLFDLDEIGGTAYLATLEARSSEVTQLDTKAKDNKEEKKRNATALLVAAAVVIVAGIGLLVFTQGDDVPVAGEPGPDQILSDYLEVWNAEDAEAVMAFYAEDAVIENHPNVDGATATGKSEILVIEMGMDGRQGSTGTMEYLNMEVSGNTVTFDSIFINGIGLCFSTAGSKATIENGLITLIVWGDTDADLCP